MRIVRHHTQVPDEAKGAVVALGNFDGVHRGHQALILEARRIADEKRVPLAAVVFEPYPQEYFRPDAEPFRLTSFRAKSSLLKAHGVDFLIVIAFDAEMAAMVAQDFVTDILKESLGTSHVVVGRDFRFGKGRGGDSVVLSYMGEMEEFGVTVFEPVTLTENVKISSTRIRELLKQGCPEQAATLLGHWWSVEGYVAGGDQRGRTIGFPTANLKLEGQLVPAFGIYAVRARRADGSVHDGVASFGIRPMYALSTPLLEAHLFDFSGSLYGEFLRVDFIAYLRPERKLPDLEALKAQIEVDSRQARDILAHAGPAPALDP